MDSEAPRRSRPTTATIYRAIRDLIVHKQLAMGSKINQAETAKRLGASRTPVVNALHKLESEGLVDNVPNAGFYVHRVTVKELSDLFSFREALDAVIANDIVDHISDEQLEQLDEIFAPFVGQAPIDRLEYANADITFHSTLIEWCDNELARRANENLQILNRSFIPGLVRSPSETLPEHRRIIESFRRRDVRAAQEAMREHIQTTRRILYDTVLSLRRLGVDPTAIPVDEVELDTEVSGK